MKLSAPPAFLLALPAAVCLAAAMATPVRASTADRARGAIVRVHIEEESIPAADLTVTPTATPSPGPSPAPGTSPTATSTPTGTPTPAPTPEMFPEPSPLATLSDESPIGIGAVTPSAQISDGPLDPEIAAVGQDNPARAASMRIVDEARKELLAGKPDDAIRTLGRAISVDPSDPFAYFYLGRANLARKDYLQAMTFLKRAEMSFQENPTWLGETLAFEGLAYELSDRVSAAAAAYQQALAIAPGNLMARVGFTRTEADLQPGASSSPGAAPSGAAAPAPPPSEGAPPPPEESQPPPAASGEPSAPSN
jgi:Tetratricopeptide repeat